MRIITLLAFLLILFLSFPHQDVFSENSTYSDNHSESSSSPKSTSGKSNKSKKSKRAKEGRISKSKKIDSGVKRDSQGRIDRSGNAKREFLKSKGLTKTPEGYQVDHKIPLKAGGKHEPSNMQLLTTEEHKAKTKSEYQEYGR